MRVKILSGKQTGQVVDVEQTEGEIMVAHQFAELVTETVFATLESHHSAPVVREAALTAPIAAADTDGGTLVDVEDDDAIAEKPEPEDTVPARVRRRQAKPKATPPASRRKRR